MTWSYREIFLNFSQLNLITKFDESFAETAKLFGKSVYLHNSVIISDKC